MPLVSRSIKLGVISDTHNFLDPGIPKFFAGVAHILHAGDIGQRRILSELEQIAPVTAVQGNTDDDALGYPLTAVIELAGRKFLVHHIVNPHAPTDSVQALLQCERPEVVVFGHTHQPLCENLGGTLYFNPGYAGKSRFGMERTVAILHCDAQGVRPEYLRL